jgi:hypothetical protein
VSELHLYQLMIFPLTKQTNGISGNIRQLVNLLPIEEEEANPFRSHPLNNYSRMLSAAFSLVQHLCTFSHVGIFDPYLYSPKLPLVFRVSALKTGARKPGQGLLVIKKQHNLCSFWNTL